MAKQLDNLPKEVLNKAEAILRQYFPGQSLGELEFSFLLRHLDDVGAKEIAGAVEWAAKNSKTLANLADDVPTEKTKVQKHYHLVNGIKIKQEDCHGKLY